MFRLFRSGLLIAAAALLSSCASTSHQFAASEALVKDVSLKGARIYVYSFLDVLGNELNPKTVTEIDSLIGSELSKSGAIVKVLSFLNSEPGKKFTLVKNDRAGVGSASLSVPVGETVFGNRENERMLGAEYLLIVFPSVIQRSAGSFNYHLQWDIYDARTGKIVWAATSKGAHGKGGISDQEAQSRAKLIVDGVIEELKTKKLL